MPLRDDAPPGDDRAPSTWVRFSGRSKGGPLDDLRNAIQNPRSTSFPISTRFPSFEPELSPDYPGRGDGDRAPVDAPHGVGFGMGC